MPTEEAVREALRSVEEPEVGTSMVELGLVYRIDVAETLHMLLQQHNMKEESMMYPMLDQALGEGAHSLLTQLESLAA